MQAGTARFDGRTFLAALTAAVMVLSMVFVLTGAPARADVVYSLVVDGQTYSPTKVVGNAGDPTVHYETPDVDPQSAESFIDGESRNVWTGNGSEHLPCEGGIHWIDNGNVLTISNCLDEGTTTTQATTTTTEATTSTTQPTTTTTEGTTTTTEGTTTTTEGTTTTTEGTTTTTEGTTTTTEGTTTTTEGTTTSTEPESSVLALVFVNIEGSCTVDDGKGVGEIEVGVSVDDAATVVVRKSNGSVVGSVTKDAVVTVPEGATYSWAATPSEGFEFASDFDADGTVKIASCSDEVKGIEVLPFTGAEAQTLGVIAAVLSAMGLLVILATRKVED